ncbi:MAG: hypothetical protein HFF09_07700 [Oscillospiraceae bacterium]|nr:hypothetical protein [Oscillospiraceae bacterium]
MKVARGILKMLAVLLALVAAAYCIITYWDRICAFFTRIGEALREKKASCPLCTSEYEDYADWD